MKSALSYKTGDKESDSGPEAATDRNRYQNSEKHVPHASSLKALFVGIAKFRRITIPQAEDRYVLQRFRQHTAGTSRNKA